MRGGVCAYGGIAVYLSRNGGGYILVNLVENKAALHGLLSDYQPVSIGEHVCRRSFEFVIR